MKKIRLILADTVLVLVVSGGASMVMAFTNERLDRIMDARLQTELPTEVVAGQSLVANNYNQMSVLVSTHN